ncbi:unnamed protein product [Protopolystoma xenopodis]|uniref:Uncharacterized protein n=1 Tax=Protopolystoma xenopodis TaxID=117903 RepID=A0A448XK57_9PLAT|nr:unnamed protein product [Protopolystoma xenopodis]
MKKNYCLTWYNRYQQNAMFCSCLVGPEEEVRKDTLENGRIKRMSCLRADYSQVLLSLDVNQGRRGVRTCLIIYPDINQPPLAECTTSAMTWDSNAIILLVIFIVFVIVHICQPAQTYYTSNKVAFYFFNSVTSGPGSEYIIKLVGWYQRDEEVYARFLVWFGSGNRDHVPFLDTRGSIASTLKKTYLCSNGLPRLNLSPSEWAEYCGRLFGQASSLWRQMHTSVGPSNGPLTANSPTSCPNNFPFAICAFAGG